MALVRILRPEQWIKNVFIFAPAVFAGLLFQGRALLAGLDAFAVYCLLSSAAYVLNDLLDVGKDRLHPVKSGRPVASGEISRVAAGGLSALLAAGGLLLAERLGGAFLVVACCYLALQLFYNFVAKHEVILDVMALSAGYLLRVVAGGYAVRVEVSWWLLFCTFLLALFLSFAKRRAEVVLLKEDAASHRPTLTEYDPYFLDQMMSVVTASTVIAYALYTMDAGVREKLGTDLLPATIPFVMYGVFRYLYLVHRREGGGDPSRLILSDRPFLVNLLLWVGAVIAILYTR
jgi:4-hydroxybenzoate polyprenyltransferase